MLTTRFQFLLASIAVVALPAFADTPGHHPAYLHALSDLRYARALLNRPQEIHVQRDQAAAIDRIDKAIYELKNASIDDHKNLNDHPRIDANLDRPGRLARVMELLKKIENDIEREEDNANARGWRNAAIKYVREAEGLTEKARRDVRKFE